MKYESNKPPARRVGSSSENGHQNPNAAVNQPVVKKNPIQSVLTALPVIMLVAGLWFYYAGEKKQRGGEPLLAEMQRVSGVFSGMSEQSKKSAAQRIIWVKSSGGRLRGGRVDHQQFKILQQLEKDQSVQLWMAPRVAGSNTLWVLKVEADGQVLIDQLQGL